ncbi:MAG: hypothetical protein CVT47_00295 [Thermoplasmata archaeon HGW-Thermoplasmata-2]|nr:MAG: hypothetical protein CVT47_00295 [Thermoplasmata archaeon HGW-Thermoplasmata-2]
MKLQWRRFGWSSLVTLFAGIIGISLLAFGIIAGGGTGTMLIVVGAVVLAGVSFDVYRMYGY